MKYDGDWNAVRIVAAIDRVAASIRFLGALLVFVAVAFLVAERIRAVGIEVDGEIAWTDVATAERLDYQIADGVGWEGWPRSQSWVLNLWKYPGASALTLRFQEVVADAFAFVPFDGWTLSVVDPLTVLISNPTPEQVFAGRGLALIAFAFQLPDRVDLSWDDGKGFRALGVDYEYPIPEPTAALLFGVGAWWVTRRMRHVRR